jgi:NADPH:quinone reductase-like Zn-dependent oxidoreductase
MRSGLLKPVLNYALPLTLGHDVSGIVRDVGDAVAKWNVGDAVYARVSDGLIGTFAEYCLAFEDDLARKPSNLSHNEAASIPLVCLSVNCSTDISHRLVVLHLPCVYL